MAKLTKLNLVKKGQNQKKLTTNSKTTQHNQTAKKEMKQKRPNKTKSNQTSTKIINENIQNKPHRPSRLKNTVWNIQNNKTIKKPNEVKKRKMIKQKLPAESHNRKNPTT
jgi:hypothetical protein